MKSNFAKDFVVNLDELHTFLCKEILLAQKKYKEQADHLWMEHPEFPIGSDV